MQKNSEQHAGFPGGHPSKYSPRPTPFHFGDRTRTGAFGVVWPLTKLDNQDWAYIYVIKEIILILGGRTSLADSRRKQSFSYNHGVRCRGGRGGGRPPDFGEIYFNTFRPQILAGFVDTLWNFI